MTPLVRSNSGCMHQKHPPAKIAVLVDGFCWAEVTGAARPRITSAINKLLGIRIWGFSWANISVQTYSDGRGDWLRAGVLSNVSGQHFFPERGCGKVSTFSSSGPSRHAKSFSISTCKGSSFPTDWIPLMPTSLLETHRAAKSGG